MLNEWINPGVHVSCDKVPCGDCRGVVREVDYYTLDNEICGTIMLCERMVEALREQGSVVQ